MSDIANDLFNDFPSASAEQWRAKIEADLKGKDYQGLLWETSEGITVKPDYTSDDASNNAFSLNRKDNNWCIRQDITVEDPKGTNKRILNILNAGVNALGLHFTGAIGSNGFEKLLDSVNLEYIRTELVSGEAGKEVMLAFIQYLRSTTADLSKIAGSFDLDPLASQTELSEAALEIVELSIKHLENFRSITITANNEANAVTELAEALAKGHQYLYELTENDLNASSVIDEIQFSFSISPDYFMQIAKIRAFKGLWPLIVKQYCDDCPPPFIQAKNSYLHHRKDEPYKNMLRTTTEAMSAIVAGCDVLHLKDDNHTKHKDPHFFQRIATNVQHVLKYESHLAKVIDPAAGSYYIESLTNELCNRAWQQFQLIEQQGGYPKYSKENAT